LSPIQKLYKSISGEILALTWHPLKENMLTFGTDEGRDLYIAKNQKLCQSQNSKWKNFAKAEYWHLF
jgi:hypothetical protein